MTKYIYIYHKRNVRVALLCALIAFFPLFIASLFYDVTPEDTLVSFTPFIMAAVCITVASLYTIRFKKLIKAQEKTYGIEFQDTNAVQIGKTLFLSDEWLIWAGSGAFYRKHIKTISSVRSQGRSSGSLSYKAVIKTADGKKYSFWCTASAINKIRKWKKL